MQPNAMPNKTKPANRKTVKTSNVAAEISMLSDDGSFLSVISGSKVAAIAKAHGVNAVRKAVVRFK